LKISAFKPQPSTRPRLNMATKIDMLTQRSPFRHPLHNLKVASPVPCSFPICEHNLHCIVIISFKITPRGIFYGYGRGWTTCGQFHLCINNNVTFLSTMDHHYVLCTWTKVLGEATLNDIILAVCDWRVQWWLMVNHVPNDQSVCFFVSNQLQPLI
jgi:hypothetical protein